jgi:acetyl-CoA carboxylase carboxyltransferase component
MCYNVINVFKKERCKLDIKALFDDGIFTAIGKENEVTTSFGGINSRPTYVFFQNIDINGGALTKSGAEKIAKLYDLATETGSPIIGIYNSNGAYVDGTASTLKAYGDIMAKVSRISGVVPQISIITGVCAGSAALLATSADFVIMTEKAEFYLTPVFDDAKGGKAETALKNGSVSAVVKNDEEAFALAKKLLENLPQNNLDKSPLTTCISENAFDGNDLIKSVSDPESVFEINTGYGDNATTSFARINGEVTGIININGELCSQVCKKISRFVRTSDAFSIPIITLINTKGFPKDINAEISGSIKTMAVLANSYSEATTAKIAVVTEKAIGAGFTALTNTSDFTVAFENAIISPLESETYVEFLKRDELKTKSKDELIREYETTLASAESALEQGVVDIVTKPENLRETLSNLLVLLESKREQKLPKKHNILPL